MTPRQTRQTRPYLPFASGRVVEVVLSPHEDERQDRPLKPYALYEAGGEMVRTADCAAEIACWLAAEERVCTKKYSVGYELKDLPPDASITGGSGGLVMALALYCELTDLSAGPFVATGELAGIRDDRVLKINGVVGKLEGAWKSLEQGAKILIPADNSKEVPAELMQRLALKEISLHPVSTVREAIGVLRGAEQKEKREEKGDKNGLPLKPWMFVVGVVLSAVVAFAMFSPRSSNDREVQPVQEEVAVVEDAPVESIAAVEEREEDPTPASSDPELAPPVEVQEQLPPTSPVLDKGFE